MEEQRLIDLEIKISHQEMALEEMHQVLFEQHDTIQKLKKELKLLQDRFEGAMGGQEIGPANEKPPHY